MGNTHRGFESHALRMGRLVYSVITSLDGYVNDAEGGFSWAMPDEEVHGYVNDLMQPIGTHLYGRRLYGVMAGWQTLGSTPDEPAVARDFGELWRGADKVVYSTTLADVSTPRTRLERTFDPDAVQALVSDADRDVLVGGPGLASHALRAGLVVNKDIIPQARERQVVTQADVVGVGVLEAQRDSGSVIVFMNRTVTDKSRQPAYDGSRLRVDYRRSTASG